MVILPVAAANPKTCCTVAVTAVVLVVVAVLIGASFHTLSPTEIGLDYNSWTKQINDEVLFENGRWFIGPGHWFIVFPKDTLSVLFLLSTTNWVGDEASESRHGSLMARTHDGLAVDLELSYQYRLEADSRLLTSLYNDFGMDYEIAYIRESRDVIRTSASRFNAFEYFYNRTAVAAAMQEDLTVALSRWHANVEAFQLLSYSLPPAFTLAIEDMEIARQQVEVTELQRSVADIEAQTRLLSSSYRAQRTLLAAQQAANATLLAGSAQTVAVARQLDAEAEALVQMREASGLSDVELDAASWLLGLRQRTSASPTQTIVQMTPPDLFGRSVGSN